MAHQDECGEYHSSQVWFMRVSIFHHCEFLMMVTGADQSVLLLGGLFSDTKLMLRQLSFKESVNHG